MYIEVTKAHFLHPVGSWRNLNEDSNYLHWIILGYFIDDMVTAIKSDLAKLKNDIHRETITVIIRMEIKYFPNLLLNVISSYQQDKPSNRRNRKYLWHCYREFYFLIF